ncbi:hypothetical protein [Rhizobium lentis]|uniref:Uncharacterized protein n=1 Tax=Rhizobium lentis TaxID=1138194 RepID=A0A7W8UNY0_9HYPH|nr:hypothetical protein [Rhizobium lentis]MBB4574378.1 hypothetical protein [Rhizobium lentis]MBB5550304.1 hypothetical protein [Rhizobium lentis]MBB5560667.1 hypothetical protein [Rhizobium lentis]MBB5567252.1 hypothetical protein [Rhizobium lentis]
MLVRNWKRVVRRSLSFWGNVLLAIASGIAGGFAADGTFLWSMAAANLAVAALRLVMQRSLSDEK